MRNLIIYFLCAILCCQLSMAQEKAIFPNEEWLILDQRLKCAVTEAAITIGEDIKIEAWRYNEFAANALGWEWSKDSLDPDENPVFSHWISAAVFEHPEAANEYWEEKFLHTNYYDDSRPDIGLVDLKKDTIDFHDFENVIKARGIEGTQIEGSYWWITDRFIFKAGNISRMEKDTLFKYLKYDMERMYREALGCGVLDEVEGIGFQFEEPFPEIYYMCGGNIPTVIVTDGAGVPYEDFTEMLEVQVRQNGNLIKKYDKTAISGLFLFGDIAFGPGTGYTLTIVYGDTEFVSPVFEIRMTWQVEWMNPPDKIDYEETVQLTLKYHILDEALWTGDFFYEIFEVQNLGIINPTQTMFATDPEVTISYTAPTREDAGTTKYVSLQAKNKCTNAEAATISLSLKLPYNGGGDETGFEDAISFGGESNDSGEQILFDLDDPDNTYIFGEYKDEVQFANFAKDAGDSDKIFFGKYSNKEEEFLWINSYGSKNENDEPVKAVHDVGMTVLCTNTSGEVESDDEYFDNLPPGSQVLFGQFDTEQGKLEWTRVSVADINQIKSSQTGIEESEHFAEDVAIDPDGNIILVGYFRNNITFPGAEGDDVWTATAQGDMNEQFLVKYSSDGSVLWGLHGWGEGNAHLYVVTTDSDGFIYAGGHYKETLNFGGHSLENEYGAILVKISPDGEIVWIDNFRGDCVLYGIELDQEENNIFLTGRAHKNTKFVDLEWETDEPEYSRLFWAKFTTDGSPVWIHHAGTTSEDLSAFPRDLAIDNDNNIYLTGKYEDGNLSFGDMSLEPYQEDIETRMIFVAAFDSDGNPLWAHSIGQNPGRPSGLSADVNSIVIDHNGDCLISGKFKGELQIGEKLLVSNGGNDMFFARINSATSGIEDPGGLFQSTEEDFLSQNYPNPFTSHTSINFTLEKPAPVSLTVYNVYGVKVVEEFKGPLNPGDHEITIDGRDFSPGLYFYELKAGNTRQIKKMLKTQGPDPIPR